MDDDNELHFLPHNSCQDSPGLAKQTNKQTKNFHLTNAVSLLSVAWTWFIYHHPSDFIFCSCQNNLSRKWAWPHPSPACKPSERLPLAILMRSKLFPSAERSTPSPTSPRLAPQPKLLSQYSLLTGFLQFFTPVALSLTSVTVFLPASSFTGLLFTSINSLILLWLIYHFL